METPKLSEELQKMDYEPLNSVEKKLIIWSVVLGVALLAVLVFISYEFFPVQH
jgi:hypothetical protein